MLYFYEYIIVNDLIRYKLLNMFGDTKHYNTKDYTHDEHLLKMLGSSLGFIDTPVHPEFIHTNNWFGLDENLYWCISTEDKTPKGEYISPQKLLRLSKTENYEILQYMKEHNICYIHHKEGYWSCKFEGINEPLIKYSPEFNSHKSKEIKSIQDNTANDTVIINDPIVSTIFSLNPVYMNDISSQDKLNVYFKNGITKIQPYITSLSICNNDELKNIENNIIMNEFSTSTALNNETISLYTMLPGAIHEVCLHFFNNFLYYNIDMLKSRFIWLDRMFDFASVKEYLQTNENLANQMLKYSIKEFIEDSMNAPLITKQILIKGLKELLSLLNKNEIMYLNEVINKSKLKIRKAISSLRKQITFYYSYTKTNNDFIISRYIDKNIYIELRDHCNKIIHDLLGVKYEKGKRNYGYSEIKKYLNTLIHDKQSLNNYLTTIDNAFNEYITYKEELEESLNGIYTSLYNEIQQQSLDAQQQQLLQQLLEQKKELLLSDIGTWLEEKKNELTKHFEESIINQETFGKKQNELSELEAFFNAKKQELEEASTLDAVIQVLMEIQKIFGKKRDHNLIYIDKFGYDNFKKFQDTVVTNTKRLSKINTSAISTPSSIAFDREFGVYAVSNKVFAKKFTNYHKFLMHSFNVYFINNFVPNTMYGLSYNYNMDTKEPGMEHEGNNGHLPYYYIYSNIIKKYIYNNDINLREHIINTSMFIFQLFINNCLLFSDFVKRY